MDLLLMLRMLGDRLGIIELPSDRPAPAAPVKIQTRAITLAELETNIQMTEVRELAGLTPELAVPFEDIFKAAGIQGTSSGWTVERLQQLLNTDPIRAMDRAAAQQEVLRILAAEKVDAADIVKDAVSRDQALDAYEDSAFKKKAERIRLLEDQRQRLSREIADEEERWREWRDRKRQRERELAQAVGYLIDRPVISIDDEAQ
jgi:hypothetical protein